MTETLDRNKHQTTTQNYDRLGLMSKLNFTSAAPRPRNFHGSQASTLGIPSSISTQVTEAKVTLDPESGAITGVEEDEANGRRENPLGDLLNELDDSDPEPIDGPALQRVHVTDSKGAYENETAAVQEIRTFASLGESPATRKLSHREIDWIERLVERYGDDYRRMSGDIRLNPMQQSAGDIRRRVRKYREDCRSTVTD